MSGILKVSWPLMFGMLLIMMGNGLQGTLLGVRGSLENISPEVMGYVMSGYFIGFLGGARMTSSMLMRVGHVRVFAALGSLVSAAFILYPLYVNPYFWFVMRLLVGFCLAGLYVVSESWMNNLSTNETRGKVLSLYLIVQMVGIVAGQVLLNLADPAGYDLFIVMSLLVSLSFAPILLSVNPAPVYAEASPMSFKELFKVTPLGVVGIFLIGGVFAALFAMSSVYAIERGLSIRDVAYFIMAIYIGGVVLQYPIGWLSDNMDRRILICLVSLFSAAVCLMVFFISSDWTLWIVAFLVGGTANPLYGLILAYTNDHLEYDQMAAASGRMLFINGVGAMGGPILVGYMMKRYGPDGFFIFVACLMAMIALYSMYRMTRRESADETAPYVAMPTPASSTQTAAEIAVEVRAEEGDLIENENQKSDENQNKS